MSDDKRLEQMQGMLQELIRIVGNTNSMVAQQNRRFDEVDSRLQLIEKHLYRVELLERRQDKAIARIDSIEAHLELQDEKQ